MKNNQQNGTKETNKQRSILMTLQLSREGASEGNHEHRATLAHPDAIQKTSIGGAS